MRARKASFASISVGRRAKPSRVHFRGPSFVNLSALPQLAEGEMIADVVAIIARSTSCSEKLIGK